MPGERARKKTYTKNAGVLEVSNSLHVVFWDGWGRNWMKGGEEKKGKTDET